MFCYKCGYQISEDSRFCKKCGVSQPVINETDSPVAPQEKATSIGNSSEESNENIVFDELQFENERSGFETILNDEKFIRVTNVDSGAMELEDVKSLIVEIDKQIKLLMAR